MLSEHQCEGWLEGYLLTGRHGLFNCYEAFIRIVDSMFNQHAKWLKVTRELPWRRPIASLNYLLASHVWQQDHNGFTHQDPGFLDHVVNKKADIVRVYLPPDANCLLSVFDHCLRSRHYVNVVVAGKHAAAAMADDGRSGRALHRRHRHLAVGQQRPGRRARRGDGLLRRHADARDPGGGVDPSRASARSEDPRHQRRRPDAPAAEQRASARAERPRLRRAVHDGQADRLRLPRLSLADPPPDLSARPTATCTSAATRKKGPSPRRSTCGCRTSWTASTWCRTWSIVCPAWAARGAYLKQLMQRQADRAQALHRRSTARTCRRSGTGSGAAAKRRRQSRRETDAGLPGRPSPARHRTLVLNFLSPAVNSSVPTRPIGQFDPARIVAATVRSAKYQNGHLAVGQDLESFAAQQQAAQASPSVR